MPMMPMPMMPRPGTNVRDMWWTPWENGWGMSIVMHAKLQVFDVGPYSIHFTGDAATLDYTVDGHTGSMSLVREPF